MRRSLALLSIALLATPAIAQDAWFGSGDRMAGYSIANPLGTGRVYIQKVLNVDTTGTYVPAGGGGGGSVPTGPAGSPNAAVISVQGISGGTPVPIGDNGGSLTVDTGTPGSFVIGNTAFGISGTLPAFAATPTFKIDQTTPGTTNNVTVGGKVPAGTYAPIATDTAGRLLPGQGTPTSTQATTVASTATQLVATNTGRLAFELQTETALTAPLYLCFVATTTCSATVHDRMIASGAAAGTLYTSPFGFQGSVYYYTTQASVILNQTSWMAQ